MFGQFEYGVIQTVRQHKGILSARYDRGAVRNLYDFAPPIDSLCKKAYSIGIYMTMRIRL